MRVQEAEKRPWNSRQVRNYAFPFDHQASRCQPAKQSPTYMNCTRHTCRPTHGLTDVGGLVKVKALSKALTCGPKAIFA